MSSPAAPASAARPVGPEPATPSTLAGAARVFEYCLLTYRRTWRGSVVSSFLNPALFLLAMGVGLGSLVDKGHTSGATVSLGHVTYLQYLAPGLLAATLMQIAAFECTYPVMAAIKWVRTYFAMLASPVSVTGIVLGRFLWVTARMLMTAASFVLVMALFGAVASADVVWAIPVAVLTGLAYAGPITAFAATRDNDAAFSGLFRFVIMPMFLFSGTFFPISQLPPVLRPLAYVTPLWHGVTLCRQLAFGHATAIGVVSHCGYLLVWMVAGMACAVVTHRRRLVV
jgi:lipooligosaccharide transport system permease protein